MIDQTLVQAASRWSPPEPADLPIDEWMVLADNVLSTVETADLPDSSISKLGEYIVLLTDLRTVARPHIYNSFGSVYGHIVFIHLAKGLVSRFIETLSSDVDVVGDVETMVKVYDSIVSTSRFVVPDYIDKRARGMLNRNVPVLRARRQLRGAVKTIKSGAWDTGVNQLQFALPALDAERDVRGKAIAFLSLGDVHERFGDYEVARMYYCDAARQYRKCGAEEDEAVACLRLGAVELQLQMIVSARKHIESARHVLGASKDSGRVKIADEYLQLLMQVERAPETII